jgi:hypothetical protein
MTYDTTTRSCTNRGNRDLIRRARLMKRDIWAFNMNYPACEQPAATPMQGFTWEMLERQLADLATDPRKAEMAAPLVSATRKQSRFKPPEMVLREILCMASTLMDEAFDPECGSEAGGMP